MTDPTQSSAPLQHPDFRVLAEEKIGPVFEEDLPAAKVLVESGNTEVQIMFDSLGDRLAESESECALEVAKVLKAHHDRSMKATEDMQAIRRENQTLNAEITSRARQLARRIWQRSQDQPKELEVAIAEREDVAERATGDRQARLKVTAKAIWIGLGLVSLGAALGGFGMDMKLGTPALSFLSNDEVARVATALIGIVMIIFTPLATKTYRRHKGYKAALAIAQNPEKVERPHWSNTFLLAWSHLILFVPLGILLGFRLYGVLHQEDPSIGDTLPPFMILVVQVVVYVSDFGLFAMTGSSKSDVDEFNAKEERIKDLRKEKEELNPDTNTAAAALALEYAESIEELASRLTHIASQAREETSATGALVLQGQEVRGRFDKAFRRLALHLNLPIVPALTQIEKLRPAPLPLTFVADIDGISLEILDIRAKITEEFEKESTRVERVEAEVRVLVEEAESRAKSLEEGAKATADALIREAETKARELESGAHAKSDGLIREAETKAAGILEKARTDASEIRREAREEADGILGTAEVTEALKATRVSEARAHLERRGVSHKERNS